MGKGRTVKLDIKKPITLTCSKAGHGYLDLNMTFENGTPIKITALTPTMAGIGVMVTKAIEVMAGKKIEANQSYQCPIEWASLN